MKLHELRPAEIEYPDSDGKPMAESDTHRDVMVYLIGSAKHRARNDPEIWISGNILVYFVEGEPRQCVAPDFLVVRGIPNRRRRIYKTWEEGRGLDCTIEVTSPSTHREDLGKKLEIYDKLGVNEYFLYDPEGLRFKPQLRGFRRSGRSLCPVAAEERPEGTLVLRCETLGLDLHARGETLRWVDPETGEAIPTEDEIRARADAERARADTERARADAAESELRQLREEMRRAQDQRGSGEA